MPLEDSYKLVVVALDWLDRKGGKKKEKDHYYDYYSYY